jgi:hypothetical protein
MAGNDMESKEAMMAIINAPWVGILLGGLLTLLGAWGGIFLKARLDSQTIRHEQLKTQYYEQVKAYKDFIECFSVAKMLNISCLDTDDQMDLEFAEALDRAYINFRLTFNASIADEAHRLYYMFADMLRREKHQQEMNIFTDSVRTFYLTVESHLRELRKEF